MKRHQQQRHAAAFPGGEANPRRRQRRGGGQRVVEVRRPPLSTAERQQLEVLRLSTGRLPRRPRALNISHTILLYVTVVVALERLSSASGWWPHECTALVVITPYHPFRVSRRRRTRSSGGLALALVRRERPALRFQEPVATKIATTTTRLLSTDTADATESSSSRSSPSLLSKSNSVRSSVKRAAASWFGRVVGWAQKGANKVLGGPQKSPSDDSDISKGEKGAHDGASSPSYRTGSVGSDYDDLEDDDVDVVLGMDETPPVLTSSSSSSTSSFRPLPSLLAPPSYSVAAPPLVATTPSPSSSSSSSSSSLGGVVGVMGQLESFKVSQRVGAHTSQLIQELQNQVQVDASSYGNHVKVTMDGRQRVKAVDVDENFLKTSEPYEISAAIVEALQLAHDRSVDKMDEKIKAFYAKLGGFGGSGGSGSGSGSGWLS